MPLTTVVIGINYDEQAFNAEGKSSADTYTGVYVFVGPSTDQASSVRVFHTGDPVEDLRAAREFARSQSDDVFMSSTFDFFPQHSMGAFEQYINADGYRDIRRVAGHVAV